MPPNLTLPICCNSAAFQALSSLLPLIDAPQSLLPAAMAVSRIAPAPANGFDLDSEIASMARAVASRCSGKQVQSTIAHLHHHLFEELAFAGNNLDYYNPDNSLLPSLLRTRKGLPLSLSLLYKLVADRLGLRVWGVGLPGHFVVGLDYGGRTAWVDAFGGGRLLSFDEAKTRVVTQFGKQIEWTDLLMEPVSNRYWITRMLQNLLSAYTHSAEYADLAAVLELEILLSPEDTRLHRDLALVYSRMCRQDLAAIWLEHYLTTNPDDPRSVDLRRMLASFASDNPLRASAAIPHPMETSGYDWRFGRDSPQADSLGADES